MDKISMTEHDIQRLINRYIAGNATPTEAAQLESWYNTHAQEHPNIAYPDNLPERMGQGLPPILAMPQHRPERRQGIRRLYKFLPYVAAAILLVVSVVGWWVISIRSSAINTDIVDVRPGGNRATLTLADGRVVKLDETQTGIIVGAEDITYQDGASLGLAPVDILTLTTPKGGTYQITLPDGSKVWLNSASTLKYPSRFSGDERIVELTGEAYFDIKEAQVADGTRVSRAPFKVQTSGQTVEVLGTQFNISAYADEQETKTTLVEGKVRVEANGASLQLVPGEQGGYNGTMLTKEKVDIAPIIAWQKGYFRFAENLESVMKQVARWYDVEVTFQDESLKTLGVLGTVNRGRPLSELLTLLEEVTEARFKVSVNGSERRVVVMR